MYCEIVYFIEENNCEKRHADLKPRGYNCFWIDPGTIIGNILNNRCVMRACAEQALRNMMDMYIYFLFMYVSQSNLVLPVSLSGLITLA